MEGIDEGGEREEPTAADQQLDLAAERKPGCQQHESEQRVIEARDSGPRAAAEAQRCGSGEGGSVRNAGFLAAALRHAASLPGRPTWHVANALVALPG